jgi:hypothetical protein
LIYRKVFSPPERGNERDFYWLSWNILLIPEWSFQDQRSIHKVKNISNLYHLFINLNETMKRLLIAFSVLVVVGAVVFQSCKKEPAKPPKVGIFYSIADKKVAFTALTKRVVKWEWNFGDGEKSAEKDPVHTYSDGGYYPISLKGTDEDGSSEEARDTIAVAVTPYVLLTGGPTSVNGKTWKISSTHSSSDKFANADADLSPVVSPLASGVFGLLGMSEVYEDTFTFHFDGSYSHDVKSDHAAFAGLVFEYMTTGGAGIVNAGGSDYGLCTGLYTPESGATFTYVGSEDLTIASVYGPGGALTFSGVSTLDFSGTEFIGFMDNQRKVILQNITDNSMRLVMFLAASPDYYPANTHALVLTFEVVK